MHISIWQGSKVRLRAMEPDDWAVFHENDLDSEVARLCYEIPFPRSVEASRLWADATSRSAPQDDVVRLVIERVDGIVVGNVNTFECNRRFGTFKYGVAIFRAHWGNGYATEAIQLLLRHYFRELRYQKATVHIYDFNEASLKLHSKLGFINEGRMRRMLFSDGAYHDEVVMGLTLEEFEQAKKL